MKLKTKKKIMNFIAGLLGITKEWNEPTRVGASPTIIKKEHAIVDINGHVSIPRNKATSEYSLEEISYLTTKEMSNNIMFQIQELGLIEYRHDMKPEYYEVLHYRLRVVNPESK